MEHNTDRAGDLEVQDNCPYQPQDQLGVPVCYVIISDVDQLDLRKRDNNGVSLGSAGASGGGVFGRALPAGASGSPVLSVHSAVCGIACGPFLWAEEERKEMLKMVYKQI